MEKIKVGIAGLGRLGKIHAANIAFKIPNAQLHGGPGKNTFRLDKKNEFLPEMRFTPCILQKRVRKGMP